MFDRPFRSGFLTTTLMSLCLGTAGIAAQAETTVTAVMHAPLRAVDPVISTAYILRNYGYMVYDTLLARDSAGKPQRGDDWPFPGGDAGDAAGGDGGEAAADSAGPAAAAKPAARGKGKTKAHIE